MIKAIPTHYNGYKFRSRTEARFAVFLNTLGIRYAFEIQGYEFDDTDVCYLPDFKLFDIVYFADDECMSLGKCPIVEVKPTLEISSEDQLKIGLLARAKGYGKVVVVTSDFKFYVVKHRLPAPGKPIKRPPWGNYIELHEQILYRCADGSLCLLTTPLFTKISMTEPHWFRCPHFHFADLRFMAGHELREYRHVAEELGKRALECAKPVDLADAIRAAQCAQFEHGANGHK